MTSRTATSLLALALLGCGDGDVRIRLAITRAYSVDDLAIHFCPPMRPCEYGTYPFSGSSLETEVKVHVPTGHSPVPFALVYNPTDAPTRACIRFDVNLMADTVEVPIAIGGDPRIVVDCAAPACTDFSVPADCSVF